MNHDDGIGMGWGWGRWGGEPRARMHVCGGHLGACLPGGEYNTACGSEANVYFEQDLGGGIISMCCVVF